MSAREEATYGIALAVSEAVTGGASYEGALYGMSLMTHELNQKMEALRDELLKVIKPGEDVPR